MKPLFRMGLLLGIGAAAPKVKPPPAEKPCIRCGTLHRSGRPWCSAECCKADKAGEPRPESVAA